MHSATEFVPNQSTRIRKLDSFHGSGFFAAEVAERSKEAPLVETLQGLFVPPKAFLSTVTPYLLTYLLTHWTQENNPLFRFVYGMARYSERALKKG